MLMHPFGCFELKSAHGSHQQFAKALLKDTKPWCRQLKATNKHFSRPYILLKLPATCYASFWQL